jgi:hypothetical protein
MIYLTHTFSRDKILEAIADSYLSLLSKKLAFFTTDDLNLQGFTTTKIDTKKGVNRMPRD